jgi:hypothetical protein
MEVEGSCDRALVPEAEDSCLQYSQRETILDAIAENNRFWSVHLERKIT